MNSAARRHRHQLFEPYPPGLCHGANSNVPALDGGPIAATLAQRYGCKTRLINDAEAEAIAKYRFGAERLMLVTVGTGIGVWLVLNGAPLIAGKSNLGDAGHIILVPDNLTRCRQGPLELVIIGAGSAGCVLANRLTEDPAVSVCLLEAGPSDRILFIQMPALAFLLESDTYNWKFESEPEAALHDGILGQARGRGLGGSSSINGMVYVRGNPRIMINGSASALTVEALTIVCLFSF